MRFTKLFLICLLCNPLVAMHYQPLSLQYQAAQCIVKKNSETQALTLACKDYVALLKAGKNYFNQAKLSILLHTPHIKEVLLDTYQTVKTDKQKEIFSIALKKLTEYAVLFSNVNALELLLEYNTENANLIVDKANHSLLMYAAHNQHDIAIAKLLLEKGADPQALDRKKKTPLMHASHANNKKLLKLLLQKATNINDRDSLDESALDLALQLNAEKSILYLLKKGANIDASEHDQLYWPIIHNNLFLIKELVNHGAKANVSPHYLRLAIQKRNLEVIQFLCENGADPNLIDMHENTAILYAAKQPNAILMLQVLLNHHAAINHQNYKGKTALHKAAKKGHIDTVKFLSEHGADINLKDNAEQLAIDSALQTAKLPIATDWRNSIESVVNYLLTLHKKEKTLNDLRFYENKASLYFYKREYEHVSPKFLHKSDHTMKIESAYARLINAIQKDDFDWIIQEYLDYGKSINSTPIYKSTILHIAATRNSKKIIKLALEHNANLNPKNKKHQTPLMRARLNNAYEAEELLKQAMRTDCLKQLSKN